jgi:peptidoglycan hydrolase-like protein with peptidoglycan-binding domain
MPSWYRRELALGDSGPDVAVVQRKLKILATGFYTRETEARVRAIQKQHDLPATGVVDELTAGAIGESERHGLVPDWFTGPLALGDTGEAVEHARWLLGLPRAGAFDRELEDRLRRFQSAHQLYPTGVLTLDVATLLGEDVPVTTS